ncbi:MAG: zinc-binding dehydrogenase, partial [bacterium]
ILGDGPIALFLFYYAQKFGASKIFLVGASEYRLNFAKQINQQNHQTLNFYEDKVFDVISKETKGRMLDVVFEMAGSIDTVNLGMEILTMGGKFVAFGILPDSLLFNYNSLIFKSIDIISINGRILFDSWYIMMDTIKKGELKKFITYVVDFENYQEAFNLLLNKKAVKVVIKV